MGVLAVVGQAQTSTTNTPSFPSLFGGAEQIEAAIANSTNWDAGGGYGHSITGTGRNLAFADVVYDFAPNISGTGFSSGIILGYDVLWSRHQSIFNSVSGGLSVSDVVAPLAFIGNSTLDKFKVTISAAELMATPKAANDIGSINVETASWQVVNFQNFTLVLNGHYINRNGQGYWNGSYLAFSVFLQRDF